MREQRVIALGFFDGVHLGHGALLNRARQRADQLGCPATVLTFDAHPDTLILGRTPALINTMEDRQWLMLHDFHMDGVLVAHFDRAMMELPWESFVEDYLVREHGAIHVVCGHDFTFGYEGRGNAERLKEKCAQLGVGCDVIAPVTSHGVLVSSTVIRQLIQSGRMEEANALLGHRHFVTGTVRHGKQLGRTIGTPTANLVLPQGVVVPTYGVYATRVTLQDGSAHMGVTNVGTCPTIPGTWGTTVETWLLDFQQDLYGTAIRVEFCKFLRPERKFASLEELKAAIHANAEETRVFFRRLEAGQRP